MLVLDESCEKVLETSKKICRDAHQVIQNGEQNDMAHVTIPEEEVVRGPLLRPRRFEAPEGSE